jgi:SulP family sulfate permease
MRPGRGPRSRADARRCRPERQSNQITLKRWRLDAEGQVLEVDPPPTLAANEVVVLQPYGSLFFAAAPAFEAMLPAETDASRNSVVILRLRGRSDLGTTFMDVLLRYAQSLQAAGSRLVVVSTNERIDEQLALTGIADVIGPEHILRGTERVGSAYEDATAWVEAGRA